jgi:hypothetical protein
MCALLAAVATAAGWSGVGDAPHPQRPAWEISQHFVSSRDSVLDAAGFGYIGALAFLGFVVLFARRLQRSDAFWASRVLIAGGAATTSYLVLIQVLWTTLSYDVALSSPEASKALFNVTFLAVPVFSIGLSATFLAAAVAASRARLMPRWWSASSGVFGVVAALGMVSLEDSGFGSPDAQQQLGGNGLLVWLLLTAGVIAMRGLESRAPRRVPPPSKPTVVEPLPSIDQSGDSGAKDMHSTVAFLANRSAA